MREIYTFEELKEISKKIQEYINKGQYDEGLALCKEKYCEQSSVIQNQKIHILFKMKRYEEEVKECEKAYERWQDEKYKKYKYMAISYLQLYNENKTVSNTNVNIYLTKIYCNILELEELNKEKINPWEKLILHIAYFEKINQKQALQMVKRAKTTMDNLNEEQKKILNRLQERLLKKKKQVFDCLLYCQILNCHMDISLIENKKEVPANIEKPTPITFKETAEVRKEKVKTISKNPKMLEQQGVRRNRYTNRNNTSVNFNNSEVTEKSKAKNIPLVKDLYPKEVEEIKKFIYVKMNTAFNKESVKAWDYFERLAEKSSDDQFACRDFNTIIGRLYEERDNELVRRKWV